MVSPIKQEPIVPQQWGQSANNLPTPAASPLRPPLYQANAMRPTMATMTAQHPHSSQGFQNIGFEHNSVHQQPHSSQSFRDNGFQNNRFQQQSLQVVHPNQVLRSNMPPPGAHQWQQQSPIQPNQMLRSNMPPPPSPQQQYSLPRPQYGQFQPNQQMRSNMPPPPVPQSYQYRPVQPSQILRSNMPPPPSSHQQYSLPQPQYSQFQPNQQTRSNCMPPLPIPQPQESPVPPAQPAFPNNPFDFNFNQMVQYVSYPFNTLCFMSVDQLKNYIVPRQTVPHEILREILVPERPQKACRICPEWFWGGGPYGNIAYCARCVVDMFESEWKMKTVLRMTQLYKKWMDDLDESGVESPKKEVLMMEMRSRLCWLQERQEFIRLETLRMVKELEMGHRLGECMCQGISVWEQLDRPPSGLMVHRDSNLGVTIGDPSANTDGDVGDSEVDGT